MLSLRRCREFLGTECQLTDEELEKLRDEIYAFAHIITDEIAHGGKNTRSPHDQDFNAALSLLPEGDREDVEERAAIMEFDGGAGRDEAERKALLISIEKRNKKEP